MARTNRSLRWLRYLGVTLWILVGCAAPVSQMSPGVVNAPAATADSQAAIADSQATIADSQATIAEASATPVAATSAPTPHSTVAGLSSEAVASLASLRQVDDYPLYVMDYYGPSGTVLLPSLPQTGTRRPAWGCSLFAAFGDEDDPLYGRNFDWAYSPALLLFVYPEDGYASVGMVDLAYFIDPQRVKDLTEAPLANRRLLLNLLAYPFDGMNEHGLVVGMAAVPESTTPYVEGRPTIGSLALIRELLDHARNVEEALGLMREYNISMAGGLPVHYLIADASGHAVLVEYYEGEMVVIRNEAPWHLATNFYRASMPVSAEGRCRRYDAIEQELNERLGALTLEAAMALLSDVAQASTQWSVVYSLRSGKIHVAMGQKYDEIHVFELECSEE